MHTCSGPASKPIGVSVDTGSKEVKFGQEFIFFTYITYRY
jgi:hypothetical protein